MDMLQQLDDGVLVGGPGSLLFATAGDLAVSVALTEGGPLGKSGFRMADLQPLSLPETAQRSPEVLLQELRRRAQPWRVQRALVLAIEALKSACQIAMALYLHLCGYSAVDAGALAGCRGEIGEMQQVGRTGLG